jgi:hypothetical protein
MAQGVHRESTMRPDGIARRGRAEDRQDMVVALTQAVDMHGLAEIRFSAGRPMAVAGSKKAADADGRVDREAQRVLRRVVDPELEQVVEHVSRLAEVGGEIAHAPPHRCRERRFHRHPRPAHERPVERHVEPVHGAVLRLACVLDACRRAAGSPDRRPRRRKAGGEAEAERGADGARLRRWPESARLGTGQGQRSQKRSDGLDVNLVPGRRIGKGPLSTIDRPWLVNSDPWRSAGGRTVMAEGVAPRVLHSANAPFLRRGQ